MANRAIREMASWVVGDALLNQSSLANHTSNTYEQDIPWMRANLTRGTYETKVDFQCDLPCSSHALIILAITSLLALLVHECRQQYVAFTALGPGGTPTTLAGFLKVQTLSLFALSDPHAKLAVIDSDHRGCLIDLPPRKGDRPVTKGIAPHRQVSQEASEDIYARLIVGMEAMGANAKTIALHFAVSRLDNHSAALFAGHSPTRATEICHCHAIDGSMHLVLYPRDVNALLEAGWGERHPLARGGWLERFVPPEFVLVYAPRDETEVKTVLRIVEASLWRAVDGAR